ncbi:carbohydrate ABC transporter permease [Streptomyces sp. NPDC001093]|uniref:carbohydrate ABC transporter permease n=1 Tax=Streptomyces sp. NPDC001093 TaxID=3154376 RepID=UPI003320B7D6
MTAHAPVAAPGAKLKKLVRRHDDHSGTPKLSPLWTCLAWLTTLAFFAPVAWMVLTSFHQEADAATNPPSLIAPLTLHQYSLLVGRDITPYLLNSAMADVTSTVLVRALAVPAAYALSIKPVEKWTDVMFFFLSTKFLPTIAALLPVYLIVKDIGMLDNVWTLIVLYTAMNLPIAVWMMRSFLAEVPKEILEASEVDGANLFTVLWRIVAPVAMPGLAATSLICFITNEGLFLARLCAAATLVSLPVLIAGFAAQDKLVRGLSLGAVK